MSGFAGGGRKRRVNISLIVSVAVFAAVIAFVSLSAARLSSDVSSSGTQYLSDTVRRYAVQCYAIEGSYPDRIEYLEQNYGLTVDREHYIFHYEKLGANLLPQITVFVRGGDE